MKYKEKGCLDLISATFRDGLAKTKSKKVIEERINFVKNKKIFFLWCAITNQDPKRLAKFTIIRNHGFLKNL